jgi:hypothetical protein
MRRVALYLDVDLPAVRRSVAVLASSGALKRGGAMPRLYENDAKFAFS